MATVPKLCPKSVRNIQKFAKISKNLQTGKACNYLILEDLPFFLAGSLFPQCLHTVEVAGSNPASPTILLSTTCVSAQSPRMQLLPFWSGER